MPYVNCYNQKDGGGGGVKDGNIVTIRSGVENVKVGTWTRVEFGWWGGVVVVRIATTGECGGGGEGGAGGGGGKDGNSVAIRTGDENVKVGPAQG